MKRTLRRRKRTTSRGQVRYVVVLTIFISLALGVILWASFNRRKETGTTVVSLGPTITQFQKMRQLVALKVTIADVIISEGEHYRGSWLVGGDALISVDLMLAEIVARDEEKKRATILLPPPKVLQARVNHEKTRTWDMKKTSWIPLVGDPDKLRDSAMLQAQMMVESYANHEEAMSMARENAAIILENMYSLVDWKIDVKWSDMVKK
jgi:hypothetical protein